MSYRALVFCGVGLLLGACAAPLPVLAPDKWRQRQQQVTNWTQWEIHARLAIQTPDDAWSSTVNWRQTGDDFDIQILGPLGGVIMSVEGRKTYVKLTNDAGESFLAKNAGELIYQQTGWRIPVDGLRYWLRALAAPAAPAEEVFAPTGRLAQLRQSGWVIEYRDYRIANGAIAMPRKLRLMNDYLTLKLALNDWRFARRDT